MKSLLLIILSLVFVVSLLILVLILKYIDPFSSNNGVIISLIISFILSVSSFSALILYFIKKVHYRGEVLVEHISSSFRQGFFISLFFIGIGIFIRLGVPLYFSAFLLFILILSLELFIKNIYE